MKKPKTFEYARRGAAPLLVDLYHPGGTDPALVVFGYGGGFTKGTRTSTVHARLIKGLHDAGFAVAVPDYRLNTGPDDISPEALLQVTRLANRVEKQDWKLQPRLFGARLYTACEDLSDAIRYCRENARNMKISARSVSMLGISAGGLVGNSLCYPPGVWRTEFTRPDAAVSLAAPIVYGWRIAPDGPPLWVIHGKRDRIITSQGSAATATLSAAKGANIKVSIPPDAPHIGIDKYVVSTRSDSGNTYFDDIVAFFKAHSEQIERAQRSSIG